MIRNALRAIAFMVAFLLCIPVGAMLGFYLLWFLYIAFGIDFPTEVSILVGLMPMALLFVVVVRAMWRVRWS